MTIMDYGHAVFSAGAGTAPRRSRFLARVLLPAVACVLTASIAQAADTWSGRWRGNVQVTAGRDTGRTLPCEFLIARSGSGLGGTVSCPGFGPVPFSATGSGSVAGTAPGGITFTGTRQGNAVTGTWTYAARGNSGTWSISRAGAP